MPFDISSKNVYTFCSYQKKKKKKNPKKHRIILYFVLNCASRYSHQKCTYILFIAKKLKKTQNKQKNNTLPTPKKN